MANTVTNPMGKHPVYLQVPHDLFVALNTYSKELGLPRSTVIFNILRGFLGPLTEQVMRDERGE